MKCDYCEWAGLFSCTHPQYYVKPFKDNCDLFKALPDGKMRVKVSTKYNCSVCKKEFDLDDLIVSGKGSKLTCKNCKEK